MSGEFGSYCSGYFYTQIDIAAQDCKGGSDELTRLWGDFLEVYCPVAKAICWSEACDTGSDHPIFENIQQMAALKTSLAAIEKYLAPYQAVMEQAVREYQKKESDK